MFFAAPDATAAGSSPDVVEAPNAAAAAPELKDSPELADVDDAQSCEMSAGGNAKVQQLLEDGYQHYGPSQITSWPDGITLTSSGLQFDLTKWNVENDGGM